MILQGKRILVTGGTGSLGKVLIRRLLASELGTPRQIIVFSRDEAKQHFMRTEYQTRAIGVSDYVYQNFHELVTFRIGDIRDYASVTAALRDVDIVFNAAALKQVPACEYFPYEALLTNVVGPRNIVQAIRELNLPVETVVGISTDKACKPVNVMGMTKAIQERLFIEANLECPSTRFICVRYGNVLASRGSVIPLFIEQIRNGGPVTVTTPEMTRFLLSLNRAVDTVFAALSQARRGETYIPRVSSARVIDVAAALIENRPIETRIVGIRPGEKTHEILVSEEEAHRTVERDDDYYIILPALPELHDPAEMRPRLTKEFSSAEHLLRLDEIKRLLAEHHMRVADQNGANPEQELLC
jgi:FlaA1/EpsC-like NDP-sugar epimerase